MKYTDRIVHLNFLLNFYKLEMFSMQEGGESMQRGRGVLRTWPGVGLEWLVRKFGRIAAWRALPVVPEIHHGWVH